ncbi:peptidoglycan-binding protein [Flexivirga oryzae]|uniref:Peptidoglycan hydrolase-like protein with peptidoglycan-binding domain n=1 Tax=Flexivirga oryzae TaxID=1794944 RepID=A0A839NBU8_9MICO|nr:peptidoglycan hydrolase-like protein with peptidoglycan-binding domain [Flexivirga oryzae]
MTGTLLSVPATAASLVQAAPSFADPSGGNTGGSGQGSTPAASGSTATAAASGTRTAASPSSVVYLRYGSTGSYVKVAQQRLGGLAVDGIFGSLTLAKVKSFQRSKGLAADGVIGPLTWDALGGFPGSTTPPTDPTPTPTPTPSCTVQVLRYGSTGANVKIAQQRLGGLAVDGIFGADTRTRVKSFQGTKGLAVDGVIGPATWAALGGFPCGSGGGTDPTPTPPPPSTGTDKGVDAVVPIAKKYLGIPYVWGGSTPSEGFDCSGLTSYVYKQAGLYIPRTASQQQAYMKKTTNPQPGDLVFFGSPAYHVGIYVSPGMMIAAPVPGDVVKLQTIWTTPSNYGTLR